MAKGLYQNVRYKGTIGGVTYRMLNGEYIAQNKSSLSKETVETSERFANTRKLNAEFKGCSDCAKYLHRTMQGGARQANPKTLKPYLYSELFKYARKAMNADTTGVFGQRKLNVGNMAPDLVGLEIAREKFDDLCLVPVTASDQEQTANATLAYNSFVPASSFYAPQGAQGYLLLGFEIVAPNYEYDANTGTYSPIWAEDAPNNMMEVINLSTGLVNSTTQVAGGSEDFELEIPSTQKGLRITGVAIAFYKMIGATMYILAEGTGLKIIDAKPLV